VSLQALVRYGRQRPVVGGGGMYLSTLLLLVAATRINLSAGRPEESTAWRCRWG
jgi:hypothetical protein